MTVDRTTFVQPQLQAAFRVQLYKEGNQPWDERVAPGDSALMETRKNNRDAAYLTKWSGRNPKKPQPHYKRHPHTPMLLKPGESVRFESPKPFLVTILPEPDVDQIGLTNPFDGVPNTAAFFSENSQQGGPDYHFVECTITTDPLAAAQTFYKMHFIVTDNGPKIVDPDIFVDDGL